MSIQPGIYRIYNHFYPVAVDLNKGSILDNTAITAWQDNRGMNQAWHIQLAAGKDIFTIRNVGGGSYMDLKGSSSNDGTEIIGYHYNAKPNQEWVIRGTPGGWFKIQNNATKTFLDLEYGKTENGSKIVGWAGDWASAGHQAWDFKRISLQQWEIQTLLKANPYLRQNFKSYNSDNPYLLLSEPQVRDIWEKSNLPEEPYRTGIFDCTDFAHTFKMAVARWGNENVKADGFAVLCGAMYATKANRSSGHAYNWFISEDNLGRLLFLEPQNGEVNSSPWDWFANFGFF